MKRVTVINEYEEGGLRMIDHECMVKSLILVWLRRTFSEINAPWKSFLQPLLGPIGDFFFLACNYNISDDIIPSQFYYELASWWSELISVRFRQFYYSIKPGSRNCKTPLKSPF